MGDPEIPPLVKAGFGGIGITSLRRAPSMSQASELYKQSQTITINVRSECSLRAITTSFPKFNITVSSEEKNLTPLVKTSLGEHMGPSKRHAQ